MMRLPFILASAAGVFALFIVGACTSDALPPPASDTVSNNDHGDAAVPLADAGTPAADAGDAGPPEAVDCTTSTQTGDIVQAIEDLGGPPPARGGTIVPGTYTLLAVNEYAGASADSDAGDDSVTERETDDYAQKTITLAANGVFHRLEASGHGGVVGAATVSGGTWTTTADSLVLTGTCPGGTTETVPYYFAGRYLYLFPSGATASQEQYASE